MSNYYRDETQDNRRLFGPPQPSDRGSLLAIIGGYALLALVLALLVTSGGCATIDRYIKPPAPPEPPPLILDRDDEFTVTCTDVFVTVLDRPREQPWGPGDNGLEACLDLARKGWTRGELEEWARSSPEYTDVLERRDAAAREAKEKRKREEEEREARARFRGALRVDGERIMDAAGEPFVEPFIGQLTLLTKTETEMRARVAAVKAAGGLGLRVFGGHLEWAGQTATSALQALPALIRATKDEGRYLIIDAITDSLAGGYDVEAHLRMMAALTAGHEHIILSVANEPWHPSQAPEVQDMAGLCRMAKRVLADYPNLWMLGAAPVDHPINGAYAGDCGPIWAVHLERTSPEDMLARLVGAAQIARATGKPGFSLEPMGAGEVTEPGRRLADAAWFGKLGHQQASLGLNGVFHCEDCLFSRPLGPIQAEAARQFVAGYSREPIDIPVPPAPTCAAAGGPQQIVECHRAAYGPLMGSTELLAMLRDIAASLNAAGIEGGPFGVLVKDGGHNCHGYSCDIICSGQGSQQQQWDALRAAAVGQAIPAWQGPLDPIVIRPCEIVRDQIDFAPPAESSLGALPLPAIVGMRGHQ